MTVRRRTNKRLPTYDFASSLYLAGSPALYSSAPAVPPPVRPPLLFRPGSSPWVSRVSRPVTGALVGWFYRPQEKVLRERSGGESTQGKVPFSRRPDLSLSDWKLESETLRSMCQIGETRNTKEETADPGIRVGWSIGP